MPRVKQRTVALHERGVASALEVLAEDGVSGLTTRAVARRAEASVPAIYEVFGDKAGLIREVFFQGFRMLGDELTAVRATDDPLRDLRSLAEAFRRWVAANPVLAQVMFSRPFADFDPTVQDNRLGAKVSGLFVARARAAVEAGMLVGDPVDIAHVVFAYVEGVAAAERANRIGSSTDEIDRRWGLGLEALITGLEPRRAPRAR